MVDSSSERYPFKESPFSSHAVICALLGDGQGRRVLDVGCGSGAVAVSLRDQGWDVVGVEPDQADATRAQNRGIEVLVGPLEDVIPNHSDLYDAIVLGDVIEHTANPFQTLQTVLCALKPEGEVVISVPNVAHLSVRIGLALGRFNYSDRGILDRTHLRFFTRKTLRELMMLSGLEILDERFTPAPVEEVFSAARGGQPLAFIQPLGAGIAKGLPSLFAYQFVIRAVRS